MKLTLWKTEKQQLSGKQSGARAGGGRRRTVKIWRKGQLVAICSWALPPERDLRRVVASERARR